MSMHPSPFVSEESLEEAYRQLTLLADAHLDESGSVPQWIVTAKRCVRAQLEEEAYE
jgi:hypothetical protein